MPDTYITCTACGFGLTTLGPGLGVRESSCGIAPGHGWGMTQYFNMSIIQCPVGEFGQKGTALSGVQQFGHCEHSSGW